MLLTLLRPFHSAGSNLEGFTIKRNSKILLSLKNNYLCRTGTKKTEKRRNSKNMFGHVGIRMHSRSVYDFTRFGIYTQTKHICVHLFYMFFDSPFFSLSPPLPQMNNCAIFILLCQEEGCKRALLIFNAMVRYRVVVIVGCTFDSFANVHHTCL